MDVKTAFLNAPVRGRAQEEDGAPVIIVAGANSEGFGEGYRGEVDTVGANLVPPSEASDFLRNGVDTTPVRLEGYAGEAFDGADE